MIRYSLTCPNSHVFEAWFASGDAYEKQSKRRLINCPHCGSDKISKALMAPSVITSEKAARRRGGEATAATSDRAVPAQFAVSPEQRAMLRELKALRDKILAKSEYVGPRFAEEARRIHNEEAERRGIHGEANFEDVQALLEEGIDVFPIPRLPDDQN